MWRTPDGSLDGTFGGSGSLDQHIMGDDQAEAVLVQDDDNVVLAGWSTGATENLSAARFLPDGSADPTFDGNGQLTVHVSGADRANDAALQSDGKIVLAGFTTPSEEDILVVRLNSDDSLDPTFSGDGIATFDIADNDRATAVALQDDGRVVLAGYSINGAVQDTFVMRLTSSGTLDTSFSSDGMHVENVGGLESAEALAIEPDGDIVVAGWSTQATENHAYLRFLPDGTLDPTFDGNGIMTQHAGGNDRAHDVALQPDGRIVTAGYETGTTRNFVVTRLMPNGVPDTSFGGTGIVMIGVQDDDQANAVAIQDDGGIIAAGHAFFVQESAVLVRLNPDGTLDTGFDDNGIVTHDLGNSDGIMSLALDEDGTAYAAGFQHWTSRNYAVLRIATVTIDDYAAGTRDWDAGASTFGACLRALSGGGAVAGWTLDANGDCTAVDTDPWQAIAPTAGPAGSVVATSSTVGTSVTASLRFGIRPAASQKPGRYIAPIQIDVVAPSV